MLVTSNNNSANSNSYNQHSNSSHSMTTTNSTSTSTPTPGCSSTSSNHTLLEPTAAWAQLPNAGNTASSLAVAAAAVAIGGPGGSRPPSRAPSILDSPTLARVERARLRLEATTLQQQQQQQHQQMYSNGSSSGSNATTLNREGSLERSILDPKREVTAAAAQPTPPWQQMWSHMKRLSHNSKVNSTSTLTFTLPKTDIGGSNGKCMNLNGLYPDRTASLKNAMMHTHAHAPQVHYKPDVVCKKKL